MKVVCGVLLATFLFIDPGKIGKINTLKAEAKEAFQAKDFKKAIIKYKYLVDSLDVNEEEVRMNLAHAYFQVQDTVNAFNTYLPLAQSNDRKIKSVAHQQLGVLSNRQSKFEDALNYFRKRAEEANPEEKDQNKDEKDKEQKDQKDKKDQEKKDQQEKDKKEQEKKDQEKKDQKPQSDEQKKADKKKEIPPSVSDKLKEMQMSEEKAKMILEAMKHQEIQYLQQNKRKATKPKDRNKPDW